MLENKKIVMVLAFRDFRDPEYFVPQEILEKAGAEVKTASTKTGLALGAEGGEVEIDFLVSDIKVNDFDTVVFIGGPGCLSLDNEDSYRVVRETVAQKKLLASICISPVILAKAGVLKDKRATAWTSAMNKKSAQILKENGAIFEQKSVVVDGKIITADGPSSAQAFGEAIIKEMSQSE